MQETVQGTSTLMIYQDIEKKRIGTSLKIWAILYGSSSRYSVEF